MFFPYAETAFQTSTFSLDTFKHQNRARNRPNRTMMELSGWLIAILMVGGVIFPLVGASLFVTLAIDWRVVRPLQERQLAKRVAYE